MSNIMIVEDDDGLNRGISLILQKEGHTVFSSTTIQSGRNILGTETVDLILLDLNLPDGDGFDFCKEVRLTSNVPIIMLTARDLEIDEVIGLESGADDYITKPFSLSVLKARVQAMIRRNICLSNIIKEKEAILCHGDLSLNMISMEVKRGDTLLELSGTEYKLLRYFMEHKNQILLKEQILDVIWDNHGSFVDDNTLAVNIRRLRLKIEEDPARPLKIKTIHGMGYQWSDLDE